MCAIIGVFNADKAMSKVLSGLRIMQDRGRDSYGLIIDNANLIHNKTLKGLQSFKIKQTPNKQSVLGHALHSIVGYQPQPFYDNQSKSSFAANCEIYNWKELCAKHKIAAQNDAELLFKLINLRGIEKIKEILKELDGVYAFAYQNQSHVCIARDILGVKPLWYGYDKNKGFVFASERKALVEHFEYEAIEELNPRCIIIYNKTSHNISSVKRQFFKITPLHKKPYETLKKETLGLLTSAIAKRIPDQPFGLLFSGGIDSVFIAMICKRLGVDFTCYTAAIDEPGLKVSEDLVYAQKAAKKLGLKLNIRKIRLAEAEKYLKTVVPLIEDNNVVKVGVGLTFYLACENARKENIKVIFSGLGSEEIFAGYERHKQSSDINQECLSGLRKIYERDTYRDDVITMNNNLELRLPFFDKELVSYALNIPVKYKIKDEINKLILREIAQDLGLDDEFALRKKRAAQYGSRIDKALAKLAKKRGFRFKSEYLKTFYDAKNVRLGALFSSGKDSLYAMYLMHKQGYDINCLISIKSKNPDSYMFHTPNIDLVSLQAQALEIPIIIQETAGEKELELESMEIALKEAMKKYKIQGIVTGALFSTYQRDRIEKIADNLGLKVFSPLWHMNQEYEMRQLIAQEFEFIFSSIAAYGLDKSWLGKRITEKHVDNLVELNKKIGINIAGEGGEFESLVLDMPMFKKKLKIISSRIAEDGPETAKFIVEKAELVDKAA